MRFKYYIRINDILSQNDLMAQKLTIKHNQNIQRHRRLIIPACTKCTGLWGKWVCHPTFAAGKFQPGTQSGCFGISIEKKPNVDKDPIYMDTMSHKKRQ
ncbi:MAG: hypothetical protein ACE5EY_16930, partial [Anaerolineae bacterium]